MDGNLKLKNQTAKVSNYTQLFPTTQNPKL